MRSKNKRRPTPLQVWKFGGASLADAAAINRAAALIASHDGPLVVVASALAGITDLLLGGAQEVAGGTADAGAARAATFLQRHRQAVNALVPSGTKRRRLLARIEEAAKQYRDLCGAVAVLGHLEPRTTDLLVSRGERMSAALLAEALAGHRRRAAYVDATELVVTDGQHGGAAADLPATTRSARRLLNPLVQRRVIPVVPGYIGRAPDGSVATLGRGGSDLTATLLARALGAGQVVLWKDVPGILTADPRVVPDARLLSRLHHREAAEVAHYGAKVLHPRALIPIAGTRVVLHVRSFLDPTSPG
ncbi:MAG: aspartate kinase, partial [Acidobacteria bacterium]|nr:aspartate kinase [Acidobacteriota bacterium]